MIPKPGIYYDVPHDEYRAWDAFSYSMVKATLKSKKQLSHYLYGERETTKYMTLGNLAETMLLEPELIDGMFAVQPETYTKIERRRNKDTKEMENIESIMTWNYNSNTCKEWRQEQLDKGLEIITLDMINASRSMVDSMMSNREISETLKEYKKQVSIVWIDEESGIPCKGRIDILKNGIGIFDLKTTDNIEYDAFSRTIYNRLYHVQAAMYTDGYYLVTGERLPYSFIACENCEPYDSVMYDLNDASIDAGRDVYKRAVQKYKAYQKTDKMTGYSAVRLPIDIPYYAFNLVEDEVI